MKKAVVLVMLFICSGLLCQSQLRVAGLKTEGLVNPLGIDAERPRFNWQLQGKKKEVLQTAYALEVRQAGAGRSDGNEGRGGGQKKGKDGDSLVWETGKIVSDQSVWVRYGGPALRSGRKYLWRVRVWDNHGQVSGWSPEAGFRMGLLDTGEWKAQWIVPGFKEEDSIRPCPLYRRNFEVGKPLRAATLFITAHGLYEAQLNGQRVGDAVFTPGWTSYDKRLQYQAYDVSALVRAGKNAAGVMVGGGWWRGVFGPWGEQDNYGKDAALLFQLVLEYKDGSEERVVSDGQWNCSTGPVRYSDIYNGEVYATKWEQPHWAEAGYGGKKWQAVRVVDSSKSALVASVSEPVRRQEVFRPVASLVSPRGEKILDFGQNLAGWVRVKLQGRPGDTVRIAHAEWLDKEGNFYTGNLREARAEDIYILNDAGSRVLEPHFTFHGFRYIRIEGLRGALKPEDFEAVALYSDLEKTGHFDCSDSLINRLQHNIQWSQQSNFLDIPSDCPQRSERLGWAGDAQIFGRTAAFNMGVKNFFGKWLGDLRVDQGTDGGMPILIPDLVGHYLHRAPRGVAGWGDAAVILPWTLFQVYGDTSVLREQYRSMKSWVDYIRSHTVDGLWKADGYGDWYAPGPSTELPYIDQCFFAYSAGLVAKTAVVLGERGDEAAYLKICEEAKGAFMKTYMEADGKVKPNTQTAYVLALSFDIVPDSLRARLAERLVALIHANGDHLGTGFLGTSYLLPVLSRYGYTDLAFTLLKQETAPSWLYPIKHGATTIWEKWAAVKPDGSQDTCSMNHYAYGAVGDWLYRVLAGIDLAGDGEGYKHSRIEPHIGGGFTEVSAGLETPYGKLSVHWKVAGKECVVDVTIPANTRATVVLPGGKGEMVQEVGSGDYQFRIRKETAIQ